MKFNEGSGLLHFKIARSVGEESSFKKGLQKDFEDGF